MKQVDISNVKRWATGNSNNLPQPVSIATICPQCRLHVVFTTRRRQYDPQRDTMACSAECPSCNTVAHFWMTNAHAQSNDDPDDIPMLFMMPGSEERLFLDDLPDSLPPPVLQYCRSTHEVYMTGNYTAASVMAQSTLHAIFENFLPTGNSTTTLSRLIQDSLHSMKLDKPLQDLSTALRPDGHLLAMLQNSENATRESTCALMELIEMLVSYLFGLPMDFSRLDGQCQELERRMTAMRSAPRADRPALSPNSSRAR